MMRTESEAKGTMCCKGSEYTVRSNGPCAASACMAWRWFDTVSDDGTACHMKPTAHVKRHPDNNPTEAHPLAKRRGYCGLAGSL